MIVSVATAVETFARFEGAFADAEQRAGRVERKFIIAGRPVTIRFAGPALAPILTAALEHLAASTDADAELVIMAWDSASTLTVMPPPPWSPRDHGPRGEIRGFEGGRIRASFHVGPNVLAMIDLQNRRALYWTRDAAVLPYYEAGAPFRNIFHWWAVGAGLHLVHGAAVATARGGALIAARGGSGKSTSALACALGGLRYLGDDYCLVSNETPTIHCLYSSAKVEAADVGRFPSLRSSLVNLHRLGSEKALFFLHRQLADRIVASTPARFVLVPRIDRHAGTSLLPAPPSACLLALAPSTIFQQTDGGAASLRFLGRFARAVPGRFLTLGTDVASVAPAVRALLDGAG